MTPDTGQAEIDNRNAAFWDELCGSSFAQQLGVTDASPESLAKFDAGYLDFYPYLNDYLPSGDVAGKRVLEIGLGYGTLSQALAERGLDYHGLDIAAGPVEMVRDRIGRLGLDNPEKRVVQGSALDIPHPDAGFDYLYTIGCLHHTGDLPKAISEVHRVLKPGGQALVMLYNKRSGRQLGQAFRSIPSRLRQRTEDHEERVRWSYDHDSSGEAAPFTEYVSKADCRRLFSEFSSLDIKAENFDDKYFLRGRIHLPRERTLGTVARVLGLDLYITAVK